MKLLTCQEYAPLVKRHLMTIYRYCREGKLEHIRKGREGRGYLIAVRDPILLEVLEQQEQQANATTTAAFTP
jgi:hypothetical protein